MLSKCSSLASVCVGNIYFLVLCISDYYQVWCFIADKICVILISVWLKKVIIKIDKSKSK